MFISPNLAIVSSSILDLGIAQLVLNWILNMLSWSKVGIFIYFLMSGKLSEMHCLIRSSIEFVRR